MRRDTFLTIWAVFYVIGLGGTCAEMSDSVGNGMGWGYATAGDAISFILGALTMLVTTFLITGLIWVVVRVVKQVAR